MSANTPRTQIPTASYPPPSATAAEDDQPLRDDVRMLGSELGRVIRAQAGDQSFDLIEKVRALSKARRSGDAQAEQDLIAVIRSLDPPDLDQLIRALACFFDLANLAEDRHRVRVLRTRERQSYPQPRRESISAAIQALKQRGFTAEQTGNLLQTLDIEPVLTAHPTEAKRRTVRDMLRRLRAELNKLDRDDLLGSEREAQVAKIRGHLACLWETDMVRPRRPTVIEEVRRGLYVAQSLWEIVPGIYRSMRDAMREHYPDYAFRAPRFLQFGSWIGGDRDGNRFVTAEVTRQTLTMLRETAISNHMEQRRRLHSLLSISQRRHGDAPALTEALRAARAQWPELSARIEQLNSNEVYRHWLAVIQFRLERTAQADLTADLPEGAYPTPEDLARDVRLIVHSLHHHGLQRVAADELEQWLDRIAVFGFHLTRLDIRDDSSQLHAAIAELMRAMGVAEDYLNLEESRKQALLAQPIDPAALQKLDEGRLSELASKTLDLFKLIQGTAHTFGPSSLGMLVVSMTHHPSDTMTMLWLSRLGAAMCSREDYTPLPIVPLYETIDDLERAGSMTEDLLSQGAYLEHLRRCDNLQVCMVGYSDSTKDGGYLTANWRLYEAQQELVSVTDRHGVGLMVFHGRGGSLGRGGGPAARSILSLPPSSVGGKLRVTEQGEVLAERYDDPHIAHRHLEQVTWAAILVSADGHDQPRPEWSELMRQISPIAMDAYRRLVSDPAFMDYFQQATPIDSIEALPIGSRPSRRKGRRTREDLRAIPYTFAWTQSRHLITAFFGLGAALERMSEQQNAMLQEMYHRWPFFKAVIDNAELALAKADMAIARQYASLVEDDQAGGRIWGAIDEEFNRTRRGILRITGREQMLESVPWLQRSIRVRNPYLDPLNLIQTELMRRRGALLAADEAPDGRKSEEIEALEQGLRLSIQAVAAGIRTTG